MGWYCCDDAPWLLTPLSNRGASGYSSLLMDKLRLRAPWVWMYTWRRGEEDVVECKNLFFHQKVRMTLRCGSWCVPGSSGRYMSLHSTAAFSHSPDAGSGSCPLGRRRSLCSLLLSRPHRERWSFCHRPDRFLQTTLQGVQRMPADPPEDFMRYVHFNNDTVFLAQFI